MDRREEFILTHYTDISDTKKREVRALQAEMTRRFLLGLIVRLHRAGQRISLSRQVARRANS